MNLPELPAGWKWKCTVSYEGYDGWMDGYYLKAVNGYNEVKYKVDLATLKYEMDWKRQLDVAIHTLVRDALTLDERIRNKEHYYKVGNDITAWVDEFSAAADD